MELQRAPLRITFRLPSEWVETFDEEEGCGLYFPPGPHGHEWPAGGALSLWLDLNREARPPRPATARALLEQQERSAEGELRAREDGSFLLFDKSYHDEEAHRSVDYLWQIAQAVPRRGVAVATFGFSALADHYDKPGDRCHATINLLDQEIGRAAIALIMAPRRQPR